MAAESNLQVQRCTWTHHIPHPSCGGAQHCSHAALWPVDCHSHKLHACQQAGSHSLLVLTHTARAPPGLTVLPQVFDELGMIYLLRDLNSTLPKVLQAVTVTQPKAAVHDCRQVDQSGGAWSWQRLRVPNNSLSFTPSNNPDATPFPPSTYVDEGRSGTGTPFYRGYGAQVAAAMLTSTTRSEQLLLAELNGPPQGNGTALRRTMRQVLQASGSLDDRKKVIAECTCMQTAAHRFPAVWLLTWWWMCVDTVLEQASECVLLANRDGLTAAGACDTKSDVQLPHATDPTDSLAPLCPTLHAVVWADGPESTAPPGEGRSPCHP